jgi:hypothetical protein
MRRVTNISITQRAAALLDVERIARTRLMADDVFTLCYISNFTEPDGTSVEGFRPGYSAGYARAGDVGENWVEASGADLCFRPRFGWDAYRRYMLDVASERYRIFSVEPV